MTKDPPDNGKVEEGKIYNCENCGAGFNPFSVSAKRFCTKKCWYDYDEKYHNVSGKKFGMLTAIKTMGRGEYRERIWLFKCDCGKEIINRLCKVVNADVKSCGCYSTILNKKRIAEKSPQWKGDDAKESSIQRWVAKRKEKAGECDNCRQLAKTGLHCKKLPVTRNVDDYEELCRSCIKYMHSINVIST